MFLCFFFRGVVCFPGKVFFSAFFPQNVGKIIVNTAIYRNFLVVPNFFCLTSLSILTHNYVYDYPSYYFTIIKTLNVTRRLEGYRYMLDRRNMVADDCKIFSIREIKTANRH